MAEEHEYRVEVPRMYAGETEPVVEIGISAHGGGTVGESYRDNGWSYSVYRDGAEIISGSDLRSNGTPASHAEMARTLGVFLAADAESLEYVARTGWTEDAERLDRYDLGARDLLASEGERFSMFGVTGLEDGCGCPPDYMHDASCGDRQSEREAGE